MESKKLYGKIIINRILANIHKEQRNWLCLVIGRVGSGKSLAAIKLAQILDPGFNLSRVIFNENDFMNIVRADLPPGSFIVADEIGSWMPSREYMTETNRILGYILQTFRYKRLGILWTVPQRRQVDLNVRSMSDMTVEMVSIDRKQQKAIVKMKYTKLNAMTGREINPFPVIAREGDSSITITRVLIPRIDLKFEKAYEKKKTDHMTEFYERKHNRLNEIKEMSFGKKQPSKKEKILKALEKGKTHREIAKQYGTTLNYVRVVQSDFNL